MKFDFTDEQIMIKQAAHDYAQRELIKDVIERDEKAIFPTEHIKNLGKLGFLGMMVNPKYDGAGMDTISYVLAIEELSKIDASIGVILSINNSLVCYGIEKFGTEKQKEQWLKPLAGGQQIGAFLLSEPDAGSDATSQKTTAVDMGDYYLVNGVKNWISNANSASIYLLTAQTHKELGKKGINTFLINKNTHGYKLRPTRKQNGYA
jgi:alkylation response protein AidB-like acyl-CoA dehydrogenase